MRTAIVFSITFILSIFSAFTVIFIAVNIYNFFSFPEELHSIAGLVFYFLTAASILLIIKKLVETATSLSTKEGLLYWRIKKRFPNWADVTMHKDYLFVSWDSRVKEITHNYKFEIDLNKAKFYDTADQNKIIFEGTIEQAILKLK